MIQFIHPRIRIGIVMVTAFLISGLLMNYSVGETETLAPSIQVQSIVGDFSQSLSNSGSSILSSLQSFRLPNLISISPQELKVSPLPAQEPTPLEWATAPPKNREFPPPPPHIFQQNPHFLHLVHRFGQQSSDSDQHNLHYQHLLQSQQKPLNQPRFPSLPR